MVQTEQNPTDFDPQEGLDFGFPDNGHWAKPETHIAFWEERMQGGMDATIIARFGRHPHRNAVLGRPSTAPEAE